MERDQHNRPLEEHTIQFFLNLSVLNPFKTGETEAHLTKKQLSLSARIFEKNKKFVIQSFAAQIIIRGTRHSIFFQIGTH